jgi:hypothetical protein
MSALREIQISTTVFAAIWAARQPGENTEDAILRRLLTVPTGESAPNKDVAPLRLVPNRQDDQITPPMDIPAESLKPMPAELERRTGRTGASIRSSQRRWEKVSAMLSDPFSVVF